MPTGGFGGSCSMHAQTQSLVDDLADDQKPQLLDLRLGFGHRKLAVPPIVRVDKAVEVDRGTRKPVEGFAERKAWKETEHSIHRCTECCSSIEAVAAVMAVSIQNVADDGLENAVDSIERADARGRHRLSICDHEHGVDRELPGPSRPEKDY